MGNKVNVTLVLYPITSLIPFLPVSHIPSHSTSSLLASLTPGNFYMMIYCHINHSWLRFQHKSPQSSSGKRIGWTSANFYHFLFNISFHFLLSETFFVTYMYVDIIFHVKNTLNLKSRHSHTHRSISVKKKNQQTKYSR